MVKRFKWGLMGQPRRSKDSSVDSNVDPAQEVSEGKTISKWPLCDILRLGLGLRT